MSDDREHIWGEVQAVLREHGIDPAHQAGSSVSESLLLRETALRVINGDLTAAELAEFGERLGAGLTAAIAQLIAMRECA